VGITNNVSFLPLVLPSIELRAPHNSEDSVNSSPAQRLSLLSLLEAIFLQADALDADEAGSIHWAIQRVRMALKDAQKE
jgi:hypothetical protein